jgi:hypothetical protein
MDSFLLSITVTFDAHILKMLFDTEEGGKKEFERNEVTKRVQGDYTSECREVVSHIVRLPRPPAARPEYRSSFTADPAQNAGKKKRSSLLRMTRGERSEQNLNHSPTYYI